MELLDKIIQLASELDAHSFNKIFLHIKLIEDTGEHKIYLTTQEEKELELYKDICEIKGWEYEEKLIPLDNHIERHIILLKIWNDS